jgi:calcineurin-like phosphoesterase family protein
LHKFAKEEICFTSDTHAYHKNICKGVSSWKDGYRDFCTIDEMTDHMADNINAVVSPDMTLVHCGDWSFGGYANIKKFRDKINCKKIYLILGNHDENIEVDKHNELRKLFYRVDHYREFAVEGQMVVCCHYPMRSWHDIQRNTWMLYGHVHGSLHDDVTALSIDVGMDTEWRQLMDRMSMTTNFNRTYYIDRADSFRKMIITDMGAIIHKRFHPYTMSELGQIMSYKLQFRQGVDHHG